MRDGRACAWGLRVAARLEGDRAAAGTRLRRHLCPGAVGTTPCHPPFGRPVHRPGSLLWRDSTRPDAPFSPEDPRARTRARAADVRAASGGTAAPRKAVLVPGPSRGARALPPQPRPRPPRLSAPAPEPGPRAAAAAAAAAAAGGTMSGAARAGPARLAALALLTCSLWPARADNASQEYYTALINVTVQEPGRGTPLTFRIDRGRYGLDSPKAEVRGQVLAPLPIHGVADHLGCDPQTRFFVPPNIKQWIALLQRGNCTFKEKISRAAFHNAVAVVIYNNKSKEEPVTMTHPGTGDIIAVMITELRGKDILSYLEKNISVQMTIAVGTRMPPKNFSRGSLVFVSISFIVLMIISSAWLIFYFIQKIRYTNARDRNQRRLGDAAKKAISKLTTRTVKKGDKETDPDFDHCAVCIESYKQNDVVRILPCKHVFHKSCVDPWLSEHCTCPMCKLNILKALGIVPNLPCTDNVAFDMERLTRTQAVNRRSALGDLGSDSSLGLEPLRTSGISPLPQDGELTPRTGEINIAVTKEWFIIASFGLLSALTLCYMIIRATASLNANEVEWF